MKIDNRSVYVFVFLNAPVHLLCLSALTLLMATIPAMQIAFVKALVDVVAYSGDVIALRRILVAFFGVLALGLLSQCVADYVSTRVSIRLREAIDVRTVKKASQFEIEQLENPAVFDTVHRLGGDISSRLTVMISGIRGGIQATLSVVSVGAVVVSWNALIAGLIFLGAVPSAVATVALARASYALDYGRAQESRKAAYIRSLFFGLPSLREMKVFGVSHRLLSEYRQLLDMFAKQDTALARRTFVISCSCGALAVAADCSAIAIASFQAAAGSKAGELAGFVSAVTSVATGVQSMVSSFSSAFASGLFLSNWREFMMLQSPVRDHTGTEEIDFVKAPEIRFRGVYFRYPGCTFDVLRDVTFDVPAGKTTAIVGVSGSGKTTLIKLLLKFYDLRGGEIYIDDLRLNDVRRDGLYDGTSVLFQDYVTYELTLRENVGFGRTALICDDAALRGALDVAGASSFVSAKGIGYDDVLGRSFDGGIQLSIGQWQRIALARAILRAPKLLILDEPTSSLDPESERSIFVKLASRTDDVTTILVSHRASTIACADHVVFLEGGHVVDEGTHDELADRCEGYRAMFGGCSGSWV